MIHKERATSVAEYDCRTSARFTTMPHVRLAVIIELVLLVVATARPSPGQDSNNRITLLLNAGTPLHVALDRRVRVQRVGQPVAGTLVDPLYAYDRIVVPAGTVVQGRVAGFQSPPKMARLRAMLNGDFTPRRQVTVAFDTLAFSNGREMPIDTVVQYATDHPTLQVAAPEKAGLAARARQEIAQRVSGTVADLKARAKLDRLRDALIERLPYHPQYLGKGTVYTAALVTPLDFGQTAPTARAAAGTLPAPDSILNARLLTAIDSGTAVRGTAIAAVVTQPVFSADGQLIFVEGTVLRGDVTFVKPAARFHRNGQLRFLFETVQPPDEAAAPLLASLYSVRTSDDAHVTVDDEGGAAASSPKTRFIAPAIALLAVTGMAHHGHHDVGGVETTSATTVQSGNYASRGLGGFFGWGALGVGLSQVSRPAAIVVGVVGASRAVYSSVFGKGQNVSFPVDTPVQVQLAPGPAPAN
jgi:hypothetical protein